MEILEMWEKCGMISVLIDMCSLSYVSFSIFGVAVAFPETFSFSLMTDLIRPKSGGLPPNVTSRLLAWRIHLSSQHNHG